MSLICSTCLVAVALSAATPITLAKVKAKVVTGKVTHTTPARVYLNRGRKHGLAAGQEVALQHRRRSVAKCQVEFVASSRSACKFTKPFDGDIEKFRAKLVSSPTPPVAKKPRSTPTAPVADRQILSRTAFQKVAFTSPPAVVRPGFTTSSEIGMMVQAAVSGLDGGRGFYTGRLYFNVYGAQLYVPGLRFFARGRVDGAINPPDNRFRAADPVRLEVHELAIAYRNIDSIFTGALGRFQPWRAPGVAVLDGAQAGLALFGGDVEVGAFAGLLPDPTTLYPQLNAFTGGAYWSVRQSIGEFRIANEGRLGATANLAAAGASARFGGETHFRAGFGRAVEAAVGLRGAIGTSSAIPGLDLAYAQIAGEPGLGFRLGGSYRFRSPLVNDAQPGTLSSVLVGIHHASADLDWKQLDWFSLRLSALGSFFPDDEAWRVALAPEIGAPRLFGDSLGVFVGYQEHFGFLAGRHIYARAVVRPGFGFYASGRAFYVDSAAAPDILRSVGGSARLEQRIGWFRLFASARGETALPSFGGHATVSSAAVHLAGELGASAHF